MILFFQIILKICLTLPHHIFNLRYVAPSFHFDTLKLLDNESDNESILEYEQPIKIIFFLVFWFKVINNHIANEIVNF